MDKKGFCEEFLTKQLYFSQERLTGSSQETLTRLYEIKYVIIFFIETDTQTETE